MLWLNLAQNIREITKKPKEKKKFIKTVCWSNLLINLRRWIVSKTSKFDGEIFWFKVLFEPNPWSSLKALNQCHWFSSFSLKGLKLRGNLPFANQKSSLSSIHQCEWFSSFLLISLIQSTQRSLREIVEDHRASWFRFIMDFNTQKPRCCSKFP